MGGKPVETIARAARAAALDLQPLRGARAQPEQLAAAVVPGFLSGDGARPASTITRLNGILQRANFIG